MCLRAAHNELPTSGVSAVQANPHRRARPTPRLFPSLSPLSPSPNETDRYPSNRLERNPLDRFPEILFNANPPFVSSVGMIFAPLPHFLSSLLLLVLIASVVGRRIPSYFSIVQWFFSKNVEARYRIRVCFFVISLDINLVRFSHISYKFESCYYYIDWKNLILWERDYVHQGGTVETTQHLPSIHCSRNQINTVECTRVTGIVVFARP